MTTTKDPDAIQECTHGSATLNKDVGAFVCDNCNSIVTLRYVVEPVSKAETTEPMTAECMLLEAMSYYHMDALMPENVENFCIGLMKQFAFQQVAAKEGEHAKDLLYVNEKGFKNGHRQATFEFREKIQKRIDELNKLTCEGYDISPNRIDELENLLK